ncbi:Magnesium transporter MgtE [Roseovarius albus]|uniref:Magnesium transporter MgtE n=1 Tax=Roseovarius albus TaxID=1247867 RepID=A0A1X7A622_9RHOB|nr:magnesium transporter [Roseovarius albus]SLN71630.1 Magnesium transporter MgtE [Roseovarius albus]
MTEKSEPTLQWYGVATDGKSSDAVIDYDVQDDTAGAVMRRRFVSVLPQHLIGELTEELRKFATELEQLDAIYVVDDDRKLIGYLRIRDLLLLPDQTLVGDVVRKDLIAVDAETDQEDVLQLANSRGLRVIAVRDSEGHLIGSVTPEEVSEIAQEEADEDMKLLLGISPDASSQDTPRQIVRRRFPWLAGGLVGASVAAVVIGSYEDALEEAAILASFIPIVMAMAGNAGIQASTLSVQGLASGAIAPGDIWRRLGREVLGALMNGAAVALIVAFLIAAAEFIFDIPDPLYLALSAGLALIIVTTLASVVGAVVPIILDRFNLDPAVSTGIFITTSNDVFGVLVFFSIASKLYI